MDINIDIYKDIHIDRNNGITITRYINRYMNININI